MLHQAEPTSHSKHNNTVLDTSVNFPTTSASLDLDWKPNDSAIVLPERQSTETENEEVPPSTCCLLGLSPGYVIVILAPCSAALMEAAYMAISVYEAHNPSIYVIAFTSGVVFLSSFEYNNGFRSSNSAILCRMLQQRKFPSSWAKLPPSKEAIALALALIPTTWDIISEYSQTFWSIGEAFVDYKLGRYISPVAWKACNIFISICAGFNALLSTGIETWRRLRSFFEPQNSALSDDEDSLDSLPSNPPCYFIRIPISFLNVLNAVQNGIYVFIALKSNMNVDTLWEKIVLGSFSSLTVVGNLCTEGPFIINFLEESYYSKTKFQIPRLTSAALTVGVASTLAYYTRFLVEDFYKKVAHDYEFDSLPYLAEIAFYLSCILTLQHIFGYTASLYEFPLRVYNHAMNSITKLINWIWSPCGSNQTELRLEEQPLNRDDEQFSDDDTFQDRSFTAIRSFTPIKNDDSDPDDGTELEVLRNEENEFPLSIHQKKNRFNQHRLFAQPPAKQVDEEKLLGFQNTPAPKMHRPCVLF